MLNFLNIGKKENKLNNLQREGQYDLLDELLNHNSLDDLITHIENFKLSKDGLKDLFSKAIKSNYGYSLIDNIEKFDLNEDDRFNLAKDLSSSYGKGLIKEIEKFSIKSEAHKIYLARRLLELNHGDALIYNIEKLKLDKKSLKKILDYSIELNYGYSVIYNIEKFDLNESDRFKLAVSLANNFSKILIENVDKFNITENRSFLAKMLVKKDSCDVLKNIENFKLDEDDICKILQELLIRGQNYLLIVNKLKDLFVNCGEDSIIYVNKFFNLVIAKRNIICSNDSIFKNIIEFYYDIFKFSDDVLSLEIDDKIFCNKSIFYKTIKNLQMLNEFCFDLNFDIANILGNKNASIIKAELKKIKNSEVKYEVNNILEIMLFSYENVYMQHEYQDELTKIMVELIVIKDLVIKKRLLPLVIKYINDGNLKYLSYGMKNNNKSFDCIFEILLGRFFLFDKDDEELINTLKKKFKSSNFLRNSMNVQKVIEAFILLEELNIIQYKSIFSFLCANITDITRNMKYILNIIELGDTERINLVEKDSPKDILKSICYKLYSEYLNTSFDNDFVNLYEKFILEESNVKRKLEENIMIYIMKGCHDKELMKSFGDFLTTMYDIKKFRKLRYDVSNNEHLDIIKKKNSDIYEKWIMGGDEYKEKEARITDDPIDLFLIGTEIDGSCQRIEGNIEYNRCLMAYVVDGKNKAVVVSDKNRVVARSIIRLLIDEAKNEIVMFMEKTYRVNGGLDSYVDKLKNRCIEYAKWLGVSLLCKDKEADPNKKHTVGLMSKSSTAPYEYFDIVGHMSKDKGEQYFLNKDLVYLYKKERHI